MKVGLVAPQSIAVVNGGVRTQAKLTAKYLESNGVEIEFISSWSDLSETNIDVFHIFSSSSENLGIASRLQEQGRKIVLSPVLYSSQSGKNIKRLLSLEDKFTKVSKGIRSEFGLKKELCSKADLLLPNTQSEASLIREAFGFSSSKIEIIPNGVEDRFADATPDFFINETGLKDFLLFAGQASAPRKNIEKLLEAIQESSILTVIIGDFDNTEYSNRCLKLIEQNSFVHHFKTQSHDSEFLSSAYAACKSFVLPSQFETPGISAMEAALAGSNIVITEVGGTKEYFDGFADFISPYSKTSIQKGIKSSLKKKKNSGLKTHILKNYTWNTVALRTIEQYKKVLM